MAEADYQPIPLAVDSHSEENAKYHTFVNLALVLAAITGVELSWSTFHFTRSLFSARSILSLFKFGAVIAWFMPDLRQAHFDSGFYDRDGDRYGHLYCAAVPLSQCRLRRDHRILDRSH